MTVSTTTRAVLHNTYAGLCVLAAEVYWLAGPDMAFRRARRARADAIAACRERLQKADDDVLLRAELETLEAEESAAHAHFTADRAHYLERLRRRIGMPA